MDKPRHPQVIRTWKVERIRKPTNKTSIVVVKACPSQMLCLNPFSTLGKTWQN
jgi:hypothetical protein